MHEAVVCLCIEHAIVKRISSGGRMFNRWNSVRLVQLLLWQAVMCTFKFIIVVLPFCLCIIKFLDLMLSLYAWCFLCVWLTASMVAYEGCRVFVAECYARQDTERLVDLWAASDIYTSQPVVISQQHCKSSPFSIAQTARLSEESEIECQ